VDISAALERPEAVPIRVTSRASRSQFIAALTQAVAERRYSNANETTLRIYHGSVGENAVSLTVKTYFLPGIWARGQHQQGSDRLDQRRADRV
jgi:hypothetical protein